MTDQNNTQSGDRNDPAIDPDTPDNGMGQTQGGSQSQDHHGAQSQANDGNRSGENSYTPDFQPEEHESPDKTKEENQTGETDKDIDTAGG
ncbi:MULTISPECIES: hypothetical protein [unclassified Pseudomonas]|uniref:hypothetical protein n=1 Tax=unclassified Pseudomonas TaxID=196821 RepID=UPI000D3917DF|nr:MULTISPECIES: hypothetical protein [unclassified Pseudomonas]RAU39505.1 hypothetical protein DBP26_025990 [Pseudomonas sp. RIT 409]RAU55115.1 hypothetical protein DBY65_008425 [Pseudomonas sp. RIT 412]